MVIWSLPYEGKDIHKTRRVQDIRAPQLREENRE